MMRKLVVAAVAALGVACGDGSHEVRVAVEAPSEPRPVELAGTAVHELTVSGTDRVYEIWVSTPASYDASGEPLPVVYITDAAYAFPVVRSIRNLLGQRGRNIQDFILVGLPTQKGMASSASRARDYTPSSPGAADLARADLYMSPEYGGAEAYLAFLEDQVIPLVESTYRVDAEKRVFAGHSYGALFGSFVLLHRPQVFGTYVLSSPSLWFDNRRVFDIERRFAEGHDDLQARVLLMIGEYETTGDSERNLRTMDMVGDLREFAEALQGRGYPGLTLETRELADEDHLSVYPSSISRALIWALPGAGPYTGS